MSDNTARHSTPKSTGHPPWKPGESGNPGGRSKLPEAFKQKGPEALEKILALMSEGEDDKVRLKAATWIAERIYGRAPVSVEVEGGDGVNAVLAALLARKTGPVDPG